MQQQSRPLPVIVISGFLGAGKTTLLNRLLAHGIAGKRAGVIVNDFGKLNIDRHLVQAGEHPTLELSNGCVCCTLQPGLYDAVGLLLRRHQIDVLVIEASGISVLSALLQALKSQELVDMVRLSRVIAVVDARRYSQVLHSLPVIRDQIIHANLILLNHCDEVDADTIQAAQKRLRQDNAAAPIVSTEFGNIPIDSIFAEDGPPVHLEHVAHHEQHWQSYEVTLPEDIDSGGLIDLLPRLPDAVERVKGFIVHQGAMHVLQKAGPFPARLQRWEGEPPQGGRNTMVVIAREPVEPQLREIFGPHAAIRGTGNQPRS